MGRVHLSTWFSGGERLRYRTIFSRYCYDIIILLSQPLCFPLPYWGARRAAVDAAAVEGELTNERNCSKQAGGDAGCECATDGAETRRSVASGARRDFDRECVQRRD